MKSNMKKFSIMILFALGCVGLLGLSSSVNEGLRGMLNHLGLFDKILWSNGQTTVYSDIGSGNISYPINLAGGTETTGILPLTQGGWGTSTPDLALAKQVNGTSTGMVADNTVITGTNSTGTFRTLTVTETLTSGSHHTTAGTWSVTTGINQNQTHYVSGSSTVEIVHSAAGATHTTNLRLVQQVLSVGSSTVFGTTWGTLTSFTLPADSLGNTGFVELCPEYTLILGSSVNFRLFVSDTISTVTVTTGTIASPNTFYRQYWDMGNQGSTSVNVCSPFLNSSWVATTSGITNTTFNTTLPLSFTIAGKTATSTVDYINIPRCWLKYTYAN